MVDQSIIDTLKLLTFYRVENCGMSKMIGYCKCTEILIRIERRILHLKIYNKKYLEASRALEKL